MCVVKTDAYTVDVAHKYTEGIRKRGSVRVSGSGSGGSGSSSSSTYQRKHGIEEAGVHKVPRHHVDGKGKGDAET